MTVTRVCRQGSPRLGMATGCPRPALGEGPVLLPGLQPAMPLHVPLPVGALLLTQALVTRNRDVTVSKAWGQLTSVHLHSWSGLKAGFGAPTGGCPCGWVHVWRAPRGAGSSICLRSPVVAGSGGGGADCSEGLDSTFVEGMCRGHMLFKDTLFGGS